jgi:phosphoribosylanthranilate isomerase
MPYRTRIKVCGITRAQDAAAAINEGVDALGFVFYQPSPRYVTIEAAVLISRAVPAFVDIVALFVDAPEDYIGAVIKQLKPDLLQFHGAEEPAYCESFERPYIKALRVRSDTDLPVLARQYSSARGLLLDSFQKGVPGGTGETFNWDLIPPSLRNNIILAGGLDDGNVAAAIRQLRPYAVDVSGGVEAEKGIKDAVKIQRFVQQVQAASDSF